MKTDKDTSGLLRTVEVAARIGVAKDTIRHYAKAGWLTPISAPAKHGSAHYFTPEDVAALEATLATRVNPYHEARKAKSAALVASGGRNCAACGQWKPFDAFYLHKRGVGGRHSLCRLCGNEASRRYNDEHRDERRRHKQRWRERNRDHVRAVCRAYNRRIHEEKGATYQKIRAYQRAYQSAWRQANLSDADRKRQNRRKTEWENALRAYEDGKGSPPCKKYGFSLVRCADVESRAYGRRASYRAARLDLPLPPAETIIARFEYIGEAWLIDRSPLRLNRENADLFQRLKQKHLHGATRTHKQKGKRVHAGLSERTQGL